MATIDQSAEPATASIPEAQRPSLNRSPIRGTPEEQRQRMARAREAVAAMEAIENGPDEDDDDFLRFLDESHPGGLNLGRFYGNGSDPA